MKRTPIILVLFLATASMLSHPVMAQDTKVSDLVGGDTTSATPETNATTTENSLKLTIPSQTDNPSTIITFTDPSTDQKGVQMEVDSKGFTDITSPYTFSALSIGKHSLEFKYVDENGSTQIYDTSLIIIPRIPILNTPSITTENITISGTGLANAEVIVIISSGSVVLTRAVTIDEDGKWTIDISKTLFEEEVYSINAYVRKYGYASNISETMKFTLDNTVNSVANNSLQAFDIKDISWTKIQAWVIAHQNYLYTSIISLLFGIGLGMLCLYKKQQKKEEGIVKNVQKELDKSKTEIKEMTLKEKLMEQKEKESTTTTEVVPQENVVTKIDFLKDFKKFDPDNDQGEEIKPKVEVSLTSKKANS